MFILKQFVVYKKDLS